MPSLLEAIEAKYTQNDDDVPDDGSFVIFVPKSGFRDCVPSVLVLNGLNINSAGDEERLAKLCSNVHEIDLSHNEIQEWNEIAKVLRQAPSVTFVNLSFNRLSSPLSPSILAPLPKLHSLVLIGTEILWNSVWTLVELASNLKELHLSLNNFETVQLREDQTHGRNSVTKLMFDSNPISDWKEISKLGTVFPELKQLSLSDCPIQSIPEDVHASFECLEILNVSNTLLDNCDDISKLNTFTKLTEIRMTGIPFLKDVPDKERRQELIAFLPKITKLNGGASISASERDAAERYLIRKFLQQEDKPARYFELQAEHGELNPLVEIDLRPKTKVTLRIIFGEIEIDKKVNLYQSVRDFKKSLEPVIGIEPSKMILYYNDVGINFGNDVLRHPEKQLYTYNMNDGDEIHVELKNAINKGNQASYVRFCDKNQNQGSINN